MHKPVSAFLTTLLAVAMLAGPLDLGAQQRIIAGQVTGEANQPLALVTVEVVGTSFRTETGEAGSFTIQAPTGEVTLRLETLGFLTQTVVVPVGQNNVTIRMSRDFLNIEGVVVTGQSTTVSRRNLANAVATVSTAQIDEAPPAASIESLLAGKIAGASIEQNSGAPGGGIAVRLRGVSTINGESEPLYVVDGMILSNVSISNGLNIVSSSSGGSNASTQDDPVNRIADINPADIERIEVLKGASAAALYGSRAANGVVLITTKQGTPGDQRIRFTQRFGTFDLNNTFGFREWTQQEAIDAGLITAGDAPTYFNADGSQIAPTDMEQLLAGRNALSWETSAVVSGGDNNTRYFLSGTWKEDEGIIDNTGFDKQSLRINLNQRFNDRFRATTSANLVRSKARRGLTNNDNAGTSYYMVFPFTPSFANLQASADGTFPANPYERSNPLQTAELFENNETVWRLIASANLQADLFENETQSLSANLLAGVDYFTQRNAIFAPPELQFEPNDGLAGTSALSNSGNRDVTLNANIVHGYTTADLGSTFTLGLQYEDREQDVARTFAQGLTAGQRNVSAGVQTAVTQFRSLIRDFGVFAQEEVLLMDERLLLSAGLRADKTSVNGDPNSLFWYPKAAASYRFDDVATHIDGLKLRAAWGQSGNQPLFSQKFTALTATGNINGASGLVVGGIAGDAGLTPERQSEIEVGVDLTLLSGRAQLEVTGFQKNITDLILRRTLAPTTGFATQIFNGGEATVKGLEIGLFATPIQAGDFQWVSRTTFFHDQSEVTSLPVPAFETGGFGTGLGAFRIEEGASMTQIVSTVGQDASGDAIVEQVGDATPDFRVGLSNNFEYKGLRLGTVLDWSKGAAIINLTRLLADAGANSGDYIANMSSRTLADAGGTVMDLGDGGYRFLNWAIGNDTRGYIEDASYVKIREISLGYVIPQEFLGSLVGSGVESGTLTLSARNLFTFTGYTGVDPEVSNFGNQPIARNIDVAPFPPSRSLWLSIDLVF